MAKNGSWPSFPTQLAHVVLLLWAQWVETVEVMSPPMAAIAEWPLMELYAFRWQPFYNSRTLHMTAQSAIDSDNM